MAQEWLSRAGLCVDGSESICVGGCVRSLAPATLCFMGSRSRDSHVRVAEDHAVKTSVLEQCAFWHRHLDAGVVLACQGERKLTPAEFERSFGSLPTDGEG
jgi:hypothetical protein